MKRGNSYVNWVCLLYLIRHLCSEIDLSLLIISFSSAFWRESLLYPYNTGELIGRNIRKPVAPVHSQSHILY